MKKDDATITCLHCKHAIFGAATKYAVRLSGGLMHDTCYKDHWRAVEQRIAAAIADGSHSAPPLTQGAR
jgi:hypothetical protein